LQDTPHVTAAIDIVKKGKGNTYIAPQAATAATAALYFTDRAGLQPIGRIGYTPRTWDFGPCDQTATRSPVPPFNGLHARNVDYYSFTDPERMEG